MRRRWRLSGGRDAARPLYYSLYALQHRGQESAGIVTHDGFQQHSHVQMGLVGDAFGADDLDGLNGERHRPRPLPDCRERQRLLCPAVLRLVQVGVAGPAHNGNLVNADELRDELENFGHAFTSTGDTEVIAHDLARNLLEEDLVRAVKRTMERIHGSYALTIMHDETVLGVRDPQGNRPLCIGELNDGYVLASESAAIDTLDGELSGTSSPANSSSCTRRHRLRHLSARRTGEHGQLLLRTRLLRATGLDHRREPRLRGPARTRSETLGGVRRRVGRGVAGARLRACVRLRIR